MILRPYQERALSMLWGWMRENAGHPCLVLPTGAGKSIIVAAICREAVQSWPETRVLMLTHVKELIEQNAAKMRAHWPGAPLGIYSAGLRRRQLGEPITFAGIGSVRGRAQEIGHVDLVIVDEAHMVNHEDEGGYRQLIGELLAINPNLRVIGLTATPYRLGHGLITDEPALFSALLEPVTIEELIHLGHLAPLRSKVTLTEFDLSGVHKRGGEYIEKELAAAVDTDATNLRVAEEICRAAGDRRSWLIFCTGVMHAYHMRNALHEFGVTVATVAGETPPGERARILDAFKRGEIRAITNANVLTTGFDHPDTDLIAMVRPTLSPALYVQMAGRGLRPKSHTDHCLVLDFAGNVATHGPITAVQPPAKASKGEDGPRTKICPECGEILLMSARACTACGHEYPAQEKPAPSLRDDDIMGLEPEEMAIASWSWDAYTSKASGKEMLRVRYYGEAISDPVIAEYHCVAHGGYAQQKAEMEIRRMARQAEFAPPRFDLPLSEMARILNSCRAPSSIRHKRDGKFSRVTRRDWAPLPEIDLTGEVPF